MRPTTVADWADRFAPAAARALRFRIYWIDYTGGQSGAFTDVRAHDLAAAIERACNILKRARGDRGALDAHGFYVRAH